jgi:cephalosporin hydroxylase
LQAYELMLSPLSGQPKAAAGEGSIWDGVDTLISPVDAAAFSALMWEHQPDLIIEIGTECGGSALFYLAVMRGYTRTGKVVTYDVNPTWRRCDKMFGARRRWKGYKSLRWADAVKAGAIVPRVNEVSRPAELALVADHVRKARVVWVIDDGDHTTTPLLVHFHLLSRHVTPGGYYVIADTRLERTCKAARSIKYIVQYCQDLRGRQGGPARAVALLQNESALFRGLFDADRSAERWVFTNHPGGWLRRRCEPQSASLKASRARCPGAVAPSGQPPQALA